jgi:peptidyl-prolyl cis-trans isomerase NIMA-interacting 1
MQEGSIMDEITALDVSAVADAVASAVSVPPPPLPTGWLLKESRSQPNTYFYYNLETGNSSWQPPFDHSLIKAALDVSSSTPSLLRIDTDTTSQQPNIRPHVPSSPGPNTGNSPTTTISAPPSSTIDDEGAVADSSSTTVDVVEGGADDTQNPAKRRKTTAGPTQVRVLHILKKHKDSRRPSSWRQPVITQTLEESREELQGLLEILQEEESSAEELQATFEELARTESDCSSAKRGGDLGFFGRRKMQPPFETASFALEVGELTKELVETSSGVHILLRIG